MDKPSSNMNNVPPDDGAVAQPFALEPGARIGSDYTVLEPQGAGSMGEVYRVRHEGVNQEYALKILSPALAEDKEHGEEMRNRFRREASILARLKHPNIVPFNTFSEDAERKLPFLTMEFVCSSKGYPETLQERVESAKAGLPEAEVRHYALQLCDALAYAHEWGSEGVVHRDLKPGNILLRKRDDRTGGLDDDALIADFGLVKVLGPDARAMLGRTIMASMTRPGTGRSDSTLIGNLAFMSPEQSKGAEATPQSDLYALGAIIYYMLTGERPEGRFKLPSELGFNRAWDAVIHTCLQQRSTDRVQSARELKTLIERVQAGRRRLGSGRRRGMKGNGRLVPPSLKLRRTSTLAVLALILAAVGYAGWEYGLRPYLAEREAARIAAEEQAERDAETRARIAELERAAETALAAGELKTAGEHIAELQPLDGTRAASLSRRLGQQVQAKDARERAGQAHVALERVTGLVGNDRGEGIGSLLESAQARQNAADRALDDREWAEAVSWFDNVLSQCRRIEQALKKRTSAREAREKTETARRQAAADNAEKDATDLWETGWRAASRAAGLFDTGDFKGASEQWNEAAREYARAGAHALAVHGYRKAKSEYEAGVESALRADSRLTEQALNKHGGREWEEARRRARVGEVSAETPAQGQREYEAALASLKKAVATAREALAKEEAEKAAARKAAEEKAARDAAFAEYNKALSAAQSALSRLRSMREDDKTGPDAAKSALAAIAAFEGTAAFGVIGAAEKRALAGVKRDLATQEERFKVGPIEGRDWRSPSTGMEFIWIPAMKMWVGKYEVTNEEYRKKEPGHDSRKFQRHSLNNDRQPVVYVNFDDAKKYAEWLTERDKAQLGGLRYRLPSEQEWMTYAQCGDNRTYPWGNEWPPPSGRAGNYSDLTARRVLNFRGIDGYDDGFAVTASVDKLWENPWGLFGVGGNVWEACARDSSGVSFGAWRGASWYNFNQDLLRCSLRFDGDGPDRFYVNSGFRLLLSR